MRPLAPLLISLLAACRAGDAGTDTETDAPPDETGYPCGTGRDTYRRTLPPEEAAAYVGDDGVMDDAECLAACDAVVGAENESCVSYVQGADGSIDLTCDYDTICEGRRFAGLRPASTSTRILGRGGSRPPATPPGLAGLPRVRPPGTDALAGAWLARAAHAEAASVSAFRRLAAELRAHGAPQELVDAALAAAADEVRHTRVTRRMARVRGCVPAPVRAARARKRSIVAFAIENAVEGCVNETWAALLALHQAAEAHEPDVRAALAEIATDEVRHAELARDVDAWLQPRLTAPERARVARARRGAVTRIARSVYPAVLGLPDPARLQALHAGMVRTVWSKPCA